MEEQSARKIVLGAKVYFLLLCLAPAGCQIDTTVCTVSSGKGTNLQPLPALPHSYAADIQWTSLLDHWMYNVREDFDPIRGKSALRISLPLLPHDAKVIYDLNQGYISIIPDDSLQSCQVHQPDGSYYMFNNLLWLTSLYQMTQHVERGMDVHNEGVTTIEGVQVTHFSACLYEYEIQSTASYHLYYIDNSRPQNKTWALPHVTGAEPYSTFLHYITMEVKSPKTHYKVEGRISMLDIKPVFRDETFLPPPGTWCEGLPLTSLPAFPDQFSAMSEVTDLDFHKVSYEWLWFDSEKKFVRWDWKDVENFQGSNNPDPFSFIYDYNLGIKYSIDRNLQTCNNPYLIGKGDDYSAPTGNDRGPIGSQFVMAQSDVFFHNKGLNHQKIGQQTVRGVPCDVYVGYYFDESSGVNVTLQWYISGQGWAINSDQALTVGALYRMDVWRGGSQNPIVRNIMQYTPAPPFRDVFDVSMCYSAKQKIHFVMFVKVSDSKVFAQVTRRVLKELLVSILEQFIVENNRFSPLELDYDGNQTLYVYTSLLERLPLDNPNIKHDPQHTMEAAYNFLEGSIKAYQSYTVRSIGNLPVVLTPQEVYRINFRHDFTTPSPTSPRTTPILIAPSRKHSTLSTQSTTTTTTSTQPSTPPPCDQTTCNCDQKCAATKANGNTAPAHVSDSTKYFVVSTQPTTTTTSTQPLTCNCDKKCTKASGDTGSSQSHGSDSTSYSVGSLVGSMIGFLTLGLLLGFVITRLYHVKRVINPVQLYMRDEI